MERLMGLDYGTKRIGIAVSDPLGIIAQGKGVIENTPAAITAIGLKAKELSISTVVVGMPYNLKGEESRAAQAVREFGERLEQEIGLHVEYWDERFTSATAHQTLLDMGVKKKKRQEKSQIDSMAAALVLQGYLDSHKSQLK
jgi:putative Holliday junction resolvase